MLTAAKAASDTRLQIRLLGELQVGRVVEPLALPASRKTRALLAYLAVTARRQLRSELCALFWEDAADPRAGLRWSLTQIRRALGEHSGPVLRADRESVELRSDAVATDLARLERLARGTLVGVSREALVQASGLFRGEFLEGLDLPACYAYHEWCMAEREAASNRHEQILAALVERHRHSPEQALPFARALVAQNPLNERGHAELIRVLGALGRRADALAQYEQGCRIFERELGLGPPAGLVSARAGLSPPAVARVEGSTEVRAPAAAMVAGPMRPELAGRYEEVAQLTRSIDDAQTGRGAHVLLLSGVPGIGKSRLLDELEQLITDSGGQFLRGRAFEAEMVRPFGYWTDSLRSLPASALAPALHAALRPLTQAGATVAGDRDNLFDAVVDALSHLSKSGPVAVLVDDLHWIEASSAALLHYAMRQLAGKAVVFALTARSGELEDNAPAQGLLAALAKSKRLRRIALAPLSPDAARSLVNDVAQRPDVDDIVARAQGNPLILIEFARSEGAAAEPTGLLAQILETRLARVSQGARELLEWACAFGRAFQVEALLATQGGGPAAADQQLAELERHELIRATGEADYEFSHDLIQQAAYSRISQPRRRLMHKHIARALSRDMQARPQVCAALAYHAGLGGQHELAARASVGAGEQGLRVFANREAVEVARRGLRQASRIPDNAARARLTMALLRIQVLASSGRPLAQLRPDASAVVQAIDVARKHRLHADVAQGYYLLSVVHQDMGHLDAAREATLLAAQASDRSEALGRARQLANSARCLVELGRDIGHARELIAQARTLAESAGIHEIEVRWCTGLLHHWDGDLGSAVREIDVAIELATDAQDRWRQCRCLAAVALIELERGQPQVATARAMALKLAASQLGEGADAPLAQAIDSLARLLSGDPTADFDAAIEPLRRADDKSRLARLLNLAASEQLERGRFDAACTWAEDALALAESIGEANESALAQATLAQAALAQCDPQRARLALAALRPALEAPGAFNARAAKAALAAMGGTQAVRAAPLDSQTERAPR